MKKETDGQRETVIEGKELNYTYPGMKTPVWEKNLTFTIDKGEIVGLAGQMEAGRARCSGYWQDLFHGKSTGVRGR